MAMSSLSPSGPGRLRGPAPSPAGFDDAVSPGGPRGALLCGGGVLLVALVALLDRHTGSRFSFSLFYLIPVVACAWGGGFSCGLLLALAGAVAWHGVDSSRD